MSVLISTGEVATMFGNKRWSAAAVAVGLIALAAVIGCGGEESVASKSAAAFEEAQKKGETLGGEGHAHGGAHGEDNHAGHGEAAAPLAGEMQHEAGHEGMEHAEHGSTGGTSPVDHSAMGHGAGAHQPEAAGAGHQGSGHAGHGAPSAQPSGSHAGHSASGGEMPSAQAPAPELPAEPASILRPDPLDSPVATSVVDAQRSAEMNQQMSGGHGEHGGGTYRHVDAGRGPDAYEGSEHYDHGTVGEAKEEGALYVCPMHPEVTSKTPGTCPKCGMTLVERREE